MKKETLAYNIVIIKESINLPIFPLDSAKDIFLGLYPEKTPIINQFPDLLLFNIPDKQISVTVQSNSIIVSNQSSQEMTEEGAQEIGQIATMFAALENSDVSSYGFNIVLDITLETKTSVILNEAFRLDWLETKGLTKEASILSSSFKIREAFDTKSKMELMLEPRPTKTGDPTNKLIAQINRHWEEDSLPEISSIKDSFIETRDVFYQKLNNLDS